MVCVRIVWWTFWRGIVFGALLGAAFGTVIFPLIGTIYGLFYGGLIGLIMGAVDAFALGAIAHFFMDLDHPIKIVPWLRLVSVPLTFIGVYICTSTLLGTNLIIFVPPILATITIWILCPRFVRYAVRIQKPDATLISKIATSPIVW